MIKEIMKEIKDMLIKRFIKYKILINITLKMIVEWEFKDMYMILRNLYQIIQWMKLFNNVEKMQMICLSDKDGIMIII